MPITQPWGGQFVRPTSNISAYILTGRSSSGRFHLLQCFGSATARSGDGLDSANSGLTRSVIEGSVNQAPFPPGKTSCHYPPDDEYAQTYIEAILKAARRRQESIRLPLHLRLAQSSIHNDSITTIRGAGLVVSLITLPAAITILASAGGFTYLQERYRALHEG